MEPLDWLHSDLRGWHHDETALLGTESHGESFVRGFLVNPQLSLSQALFWSQAVMVVLHVRVSRSRKRLVAKCNA